jgi:hypothetical protein
LWMLFSSVTYCSLLPLLLLLLLLLLFHHCVCLSCEPTDPAGAATAGVALPVLPSPSETTQAHPTPLSPRCLCTH